MQAGRWQSTRVVLKNTSGWIRTCPRASSQGRSVTPHGPGSGALSCWTEICYVRVSASERSYVGAFSPRGPNAGGQYERAGEARRRGQVDVEVLFREPEEQSVLDRYSSTSVEWRMVY